MMLRDLAALLPSLVVGAAMLALLISLLRREMGDKQRDRRRGDKGPGEP